jgi:ATP-binding cassette subfamily C protein LapB
MSAQQTQESPQDSFEQKQEHKSELPKIDYYLNALIWFTKNDQVTFTPLDIFGGKQTSEALTGSDFINAAQTLGYQVNKQRCPLENLPTDHLPVLLSLQGQQACILVKKTSSQYQIITLGTTFEKRTIHKNDLKRFYAGDYFIVEKTASFDKRVEHAHLQSEQHWFWSILKKSYRVYMEVFFASIFINIFAIISSVFAMNVYDRVIPNQAIETLYTLCLGMFFMYLFDLALKTIRSYFIDMTNKKTDVELNALIFKHLSHISLKNKPSSVGSFSSLMGQFESFREFFNSASMATFIDIPFCFLFLFIIHYLGGPLVIIPILALPCIALCAIITSYLCYELNKESMKVSSQKQTLLIEYLSAIEGVKYWNAQRQVGQKWDDVITQNAIIFGKIKFRQSLNTHICQMIQSISYVVLIAYGVQLIIAQQMSMGALIGCSILFSRALAPIVNLGGLIVRWQNAMTSLKGMDDVIKLPQEHLGKDLLADNAKGHFQFSDVSLSYSQEGQPALKNISLNIHPGEKIGIIGANGSGKSSFLKLFLGLYDPDQGSLLLDGLDIRQYNPTSLRALVGYVPQDIHLLCGTLRDNITMGYPHINDEQVLNACKQAGLMSLIGNCEKGLNKMITERGFSLSGGQRQSLALARALLLNPKILIFDEPTSSLDHQSEAEFLQTISQVSQDKTLIIVSHRQSPLHLTHKILIFHQGQIVGEKDTASLLHAQKEQVEKSNQK